MPLVQKWQKHNNDDKLVPLKAAELKYDDYDAIEKYACSNTLLKYEEKEEFSKVGQKSYDLEANFYFKCEVLHFVDDKIRIRYFSNFTDPIVGTFKNTSLGFNSTGQVPDKLRHVRNVTISSASNFE